MLYYLFRFFESLGIPGSGMWEYTSFRSLMAFIIALVFSLWLGKYFIKWMSSHQASVEEKKFNAAVDPDKNKKEKFHL